MLASIAYCGPAALPENLGDPLEWRPSADRGARGAGYPDCTRSRCKCSRRLGRDCIDDIDFYLASMCPVLGTLFSKGFSSRAAYRCRGASLCPGGDFPMPRLLSPTLAVLVGAHAAILWFWHAPGPYSWGLASVPAYWLMADFHSCKCMVSLAGDLCADDAIWLGTRRVGRDDRSDGTLAALIAFAPRPLYAVHFSSTAAWGLSPLVDQQLAGLLNVGTSNFALSGVGDFRMAWSSLRPAEPVA